MLERTMRYALQESARIFYCHFDEQAKRKGMQRCRAAEIESRRNRARERRGTGQELERGRREKKEKRQQELRQQRRHERRQQSMQKRGQERRQEAGTAEEAAEEAGAGAVSSR